MIERLTAMPCKYEHRAPAEVSRIMADPVDSETPHIYWLKQPMTPDQVSGRFSVNVPLTKYWDFPRKHLCDRLEDLFG